MPAWDLATPAHGILEEGLRALPRLDRVEPQIVMETAVALRVDHDGPRAGALVRPQLDERIHGDVGAVLELRREPVPADGVALFLLAARGLALGERE